MPQNLQRDEENNTRKKRLASTKRGPGTFVYDGSLYDTEWIPTVKLTGAKEPVFDANGLPVVDRAGRQVFQKIGVPVKDEAGNPVLGGPPKVKRTKLDTFKVRRTEFPEGKPIYVADKSLALKLRGMDGFIEVDGEPDEEAAEEAAEASAAAEVREKRGAKKKAKRAAKAEEAAEGSDPAED